MQRSGLRTAVAMAAALLLAGPASASIVSVGSDADFIADYLNSGLFTKLFGANSRWGNNGSGSPLAGDWEYAVVDANDANIGTGGQFDWSTEPDHAYRFFWDDGTNGAEYELYSDDSFAAQVGSHAALVAGNPGANALAVRARANGGDQSILTDITVIFDVGGSVNLGTLTGDGDAEYLLLVDSRIGGGFTVEGAATLTDGSGSIPMYGFKVGTLVPVPAAVWLFGSALAVMGWLRRRQ